MRKNADTEKPNKLSQIREDASEQKSYGSERPQKKRLRFASSASIEDVSVSEEGEDEIEEIEGSDQENHISESKDMKDAKEMEKISRRMAKEFQASKKRKSQERDAGTDSKYSNRWMATTEVIKVQLAQKVVPSSDHKSAESNGKKKSLIEDLKLMPAKPSAIRSRRQKSKDALNRSRSIDSLESDSDNLFDFMDGDATKAAKRNKENKKPANGPANEPKNDQSFKSAQSA